MLKAPPPVPPFKVYIVFFHSENPEEVLLPAAPSLLVSGEPSPLARRPHVAVLSAYRSECRPLSAGHVAQPHVVGRGRSDGWRRQPRGHPKIKSRPAFPCRKDCGVLHRGDPHPAALPKHCAVTNIKEACVSAGPQTSYSLLCLTRYRERHTLDLAYKEVTRR